jgi:alkylhydroperoxidase family enzyme
MRDPEQNSSADLRIGAPDSAIDRRAARCAKLRLTRHRHDASLCTEQARWWCLSQSISCGYCVNHHRGLTNFQPGEIDDLCDV